MRPGVLNILVDIPERDRIAQKTTGPIDPMQCTETIQTAQTPDDGDGQGQVPVGSGLESKRCFLHPGEEKMSRSLSVLDDHVLLWPSEARFPHS